MSLVLPAKIATGASWSSGVMGLKYDVSVDELVFEEALLGKARTVGDVKTELSCDSELAGGRPSSRSLRRAATVKSDTSRGLMLRFRRSRACASSTDALYASSLLIKTSMSKKPSSEDGSSCWDPLLKPEKFATSPARLSYATSVAVSSEVFRCVCSRSTERRDCRPLLCHLQSVSFATVADL